MVKHRIEANRQEFDHGNALVIDYAINSTSILAGATIPYTTHDPIWMIHCLDDGIMEFDGSWLSLPVRYHSRSKIEAFG